MLRKFYLYRRTDVSGVSGTGVVAHGVQHLGNGKVVIFWATGDKPNSITVWDSLAAAKEIHGHNGGTEFIWNDDNSHPAGKALAAVNPRDWPQTYTA